MAVEKKEKQKTGFSKAAARANAEAKAKADAKKKKGASAQQEKKSGGLKNYFKGVRLETKKVVWPTKKELVSYTVVVFIACAFFGLFLWGVDSGLLAIIREVFSISI